MEHTTDPAAGSQGQSNQSVNSASRADPVGNRLNGATGQLSSANPTQSRVSQRSAEFFERAKKVSPGGVHSPVRAFKGVGGVPRFIESAHGAILSDADGRNYVDFCMSWGPLIFGHQDSEIAEAVKAALGRGWSFGAADRGSLEFAEFLTSHIPWLESVRFVSSGTEAVMSALRVARAATGRDKILKFDGCYHGHADSMLVRAGSGLAEMAVPDSAGVNRAVAADTVVVPLDNIGALEEAFLIHPEQIAAVIVEPVPANNGLLLQTDDFLKEVEKTARRYGALVIFDEVITGFRVGFQGMAGLSGVRPDLVTYGKVIGGGFPVGAYGGRRELMDLVAPVGPVYQAGTLSANPVAMAAGLAMVKKLARTNPYESLALNCAQLSAQLQAIGAEYGVPVQVPHFASLFWIVFPDGDRDPRQPFPAIRAIGAIPPSQKAQFAEVFHYLLDNGIYLAPSGYEVCFLSTAHQEGHLAALTESFTNWIKR